MTTSSRDLVDKKILTQDGREIGHVEGLELDIESWHVRSLEVRLRRDTLEALNIKRPLFGTRTVRLGVGHVSGVTDTVVLKTKLEEVGALIGGADEGAEATQPDAEQPERE